MDNNGQQPGQPDPAVVPPVIPTGDNSGTPAPVDQNPTAGVPPMNPPAPESTPTEPRVPAQGGQQWPNQNGTDGQNPAGTPPAAGNGGM